MATNSNEVQTRVLNVKTIHFSYNLAQEVATDHDYDYRLNFQEFFTTETDLFRLTLTISICPVNQTDLEKEIASLKVVNDFHIKNIGQFVTNGKLNLSEELDKMYISMSYSHARALFADRLSGMNLAPIPILPIDQIYKAKQSQSSSQ